MKTLFTFLLCLLLTTAHAQAPWPRNPKTHKVEFAGVLPWPASAKTEAQRRALVRRWYLAKLTDSTPEEVAADAATNQTNGLLTYAGLPKVIVIRQGSGNDGVLFDYTANLVSDSKGLNYSFSRFNWTRSGDVEAGNATASLESVLEAKKPEQQAALAALRKRLAAAGAGWN